MSVDRMAESARMEPIWVCPVHVGEYDQAGLCATRGLYGVICNLELVEYVPAEQLRGAVEALDTIRAATGANYSTAHVGAVARRAICAYDSRFGGEE